MNDQLVRWGILASGVLAAAIGVVITIRTRPAGAKPRVAHGFYVWPNTMSLALVAIALGVVIGSKAIDLLTARTLAGLVVGWMILFALFLASRTAGRKLASDVASVDQSRMGYALLSGSGLLVCAAALLGIGIVALVGPGWRAMHGGPPLVVALGFWVMAVFWSLPSAIYRWLLARETDAGPSQLAVLCAQFRSTPGETAFLAASALACAIGIAGFRFEKAEIAGRLYPMAVFAMSLFVGMTVIPMLAPGRSGGGGSRARGMMRWLGMEIYLGVTLISAYLLAAFFLEDLRAFYCYGIGFLTAMLLMLTARYRPPFVGIGSPLGVEIAVAEALMVPASAVLAFRFMGGYGIALCTVGLLSSLAVLFPIGALWAARRTQDSDEADLPFMAHAASRFAELITAAGAFLLIVALIRLFTERVALGPQGIDITAPYPLTGLVIGGCFPVLLRTLSLSGRNGMHAATFEASELERLGRWAAFRTMGMWVLGGVAPLLVAFFWRAEAAGAFLVGLAASELFLILTLWLGEVRNTADEGSRVATRAAHVLAVGSALVTVLLVPPLMRLTQEVSKGVRIQSLVAVFALVAAWVVISAWRRLRAGKASAGGFDR